MADPEVTKRRWRLQAAVLVSCLSAVAASAQQQTPPRPEAAVVKRPALAAAMAERSVVHADTFKAEVFKGTALSESQKQSVLSNLAGVGLSLQTAPTTMQQFFGPVPPAQATGMACVINYAGTAAELLALRKIVAGLIEKNKAADLPVFVQGIPKDCPYRELYFYLELLAKLTKE